MAHRAMLIHLFLLFLIVVKAKSVMEAKVVGGELVEIEFCAFSAFLSIHKDNGYFICGSSIVNQRVLLTAAHCFDHVDKKSKVKASVGHANNQKGQPYNVLGFKTHENYEPVHITNDVCLVSLQETLKFGTKVNRVALASETPTNGIATIAGWGLIDEEEKQHTDYLHMVNQNIWTRERCLKVIPRVPEGAFCAGKMKSDKFPSLGDSGSALMMDGYKQVGIVSYKRMDISSSIIVYMDVAYYKAWINENTRTLFCSQKSNYLKKLG